MDTTATAREIIELLDHMTGDALDMALGDRHDDATKRIAELLEKKG